MTKCQLILFQLACFSSTKNIRTCNTSALLEWTKYHRQQNKYFIFLMSVTWFTPTSKNPINFLPKQKKTGKSGTCILQCNPPDTAYSEIRYMLQKPQFLNKYFIEKTKGPQQKMDTMTKCKMYKE